MIQLHNCRLWRFILAAMMIPLALIAFWPVPVDQPVQGQLADFLSFLHRHGFPKLFNYEFVEATANIALFMPLGFISALACAGKRWWQIAALGLLISGFIELGQLMFLHSRFASPADLMTNTSGAAIGGLLATWALKKLEARRLSAADL